MLNFIMADQIYEMRNHCPLIFCYNVMVYLVLDYGIQKTFLGSCSFIDKLRVKKPLLFDSNTTQCYVVFQNNKKWLGDNCWIEKNLSKIWKNNKMLINPKTSKTLSSKNSKTIKNFWKKFHSWSYIYIAPKNWEKKNQSS